MARCRLTHRRRRHWKEEAMGDNPEDCPVCLTTYDDALRRAYTMPCGHSLCSRCIDGLRDRSHVTCPSCRVRHAVPEGLQFHLSYTPEAFIKRLNLTVAAESAAAASLPPKDLGGQCTGIGGRQWEAAGLSPSVLFLLQEQEAKILAAISTCQEIHAQLDEYQTTLAGWCQQQQWLENGLQKVIDESHSARMLVLQDESRAVAKKEETKERERHLHAALEALRRVTSTQEALPAIDDANHSTDEAEQRAGECREMFPDVVVAAAARKTMDESTAAMEAAKQVWIAQETSASAIKEPRHQPPAWTITEKLKDMLAQPNLTAEDLHSTTRPSIWLLLAQRVFAMHQVEGRHRFARITIEDDRLFLHALQDLSLPLGAAKLQLSEVVPACPPCLVFLDLCWPASMHQRVIIRLSPDTPMARQFVLLCSGERGPSYANTRLWGVGDKGLPGERLWFGDYENNDGTGGAALLPNLSKGKYQKSASAGALWGTWQWGGRTRGAQFGITTRDRVGGVWSDVFGEVVEGMNCLRAAINHSDITEVIVVDCGVILKRQ